MAALSAPLPPVWSKSQCVLTAHRSCSRGIPALVEVGQQRLGDALAHSRVDEQRRVVADEQVERDEALAERRLDAMQSGPDLHVIDPRSQRSTPSSTTRSPARVGRMWGPAGFAHPSPSRAPSMAASSMRMPAPGSSLEHDAAVDELVVDEHAVSEVDRLHLGRQVVRNRRHGVRDGGVGVVADRADRQVARRRGESRAGACGVTPQTAPAWTTSGAPASKSGRNCSTPVRFSPVATAARIAVLSRACPTASQRRSGSSTQSRSTCSSSALDVAHGLLDLPRLVRVEHEPGSRRVAARATSARMPQPPQVGVEIEPALELAGDVAALGERRRRTSRAHRRRARCRGPTRTPGTNRSRPPSSRHSGSPASLGLDVPERGVERRHSAVGGAGVTRLEHLRRASGRTAPSRASRVLPVDGREEPGEVGVRADADALDAVVGLDDDDRHLGDGLVMWPLTSPIGARQCWLRRERAVAGDLHVALVIPWFRPRSCPRRGIAGRTGR